MEDLYEILEISHDATQDEIKKKYHKLVLQYHPDKHPGDKDNEEKFKKINAAYTVLKDPDKRAQYDRFGTTGNNDSYGNMSGMDFGDLFGDIFSQVFGGASRNSNPNARRQGSSLEMILKISLLEASTGLTRNIDVMRWEKCEVCNGTGAKSGTKPETCSKCHGTGQVRQAQQSVFGQFISVTTCPDCHGTGKIIKDKCINCDGEGQIHKKHNLEVKIPAGVDRGTRLRIPGAGDAGINGGSAGDLFLVIDVEPDLNFERHGKDLHTKLLLTYPQAVLGAEVDIITLNNGTEKIKVPAGTPQGEILKLSGRGMPVLNNPNSKGDLYAHVFIDVPTKLTDKQRELIKNLADEMKAPVNEEGFFDKFKNLFK